MEKALFQMGGLGAAFDEAVRKAGADGFAARLLERDATLWKEDESEKALIENALGWLGLPELMAGRVDEIDSLVSEVREAGYTDVVLLGMGGSSLAPLVMAVARMTTRHQNPVSPFAKCPKNH